MLDWLDGTWPNRTPGSAPLDAGGATVAGLEKFRKTQDVRNAGAGMGKRGNGSLMRCIPTALFETTPSGVIERSLLISAITHNDPHCIISCAAYNTIVHHLIRATPPLPAIRAGRAVAQSFSKKHPSASKAVTAAIDLGSSMSIKRLADEGPAGDLECLGAGLVTETLAIAVAAARDMRCFEDVVVDVVRIGRDTDTNAAVAGGGGLSGRGMGFGRFPRGGGRFCSLGPSLRGLWLRLLGI